MGKIVWREHENLVVLRRLLASGWTASQIGAEFSRLHACNVTRNAIIGIVHRLSAEKILTSGFTERSARTPRPVIRIKLKRLNTAEEPVKREKLRRGKLNQLEVVTLYEPVEFDQLAEFNWITVETGQATQLSGIEHMSCRWPVHGDTGSTFLFCGAQRLHDGEKCTSSYCGYHTMVARRAPPDPDAPRIHPSRRRKQGAGGVS